MSDQTETSAILNPITLIDRTKSILKVDEQSLLPNYEDRRIIIEVGCGCHYWSNEIILLSQPSDRDHDRLNYQSFFPKYCALLPASSHTLVREEIAC